MSIIVGLFAAALLLLVPVKVAANYVQAGRTGVGSCLIAVIIAGGFQKITERVLGEYQILAFITTLAIVPLAYMLVLDTTYKKGLIVGAVQIVLAAALFVLLLPLLSQYGTVTVNVGK